MNPAFREYRIPVYAGLARRLDGRFTLLYSAARSMRALANASRKPRVFSRWVDGGVQRHLPNGKGPGPRSRKQLLADSVPTGASQSTSQVDPEVVIAEGFFQWTPTALWWRRTSHGALVVAYERTMHTERRAGLLRKVYRKLAARTVDAVCCNGSLSREYCIRAPRDPGVTDRGRRDGCKPDYLRRHARPHRRRRAPFIWTKPPGLASCMLVVSYTQRVSTHSWLRGGNTSATFVRQGSDH